MISVHAPVFLSDAAATDQFARALAAGLGAGDSVLLDGEIGAGKTHFARAVIQTFVAEDVPSPTFTLVQMYEAPAFEIWHADLYRLSHPDEAIELGLLAAFETALCLVEWPDRLGMDRPKQALTLRILVSGAGRLVELLSDNPAWQARLEGMLDV